MPRNFFVPKLCADRCQQLTDAVVQSKEEKGFQADKASFKTRKMATLPYSHGSPASCPVVARGALVEASSVIFGVVDSLAHCPAKETVDRVEGNSKPCVDKWKSLDTMLGGGFSSATKKGLKSLTPLPLRAMQ